MDTPAPEPKRYVPVDLAMDGQPARSKPIGLSTKGDEAMLLLKVTGLGYVVMRTKAAGLRKFSEACLAIITDREAEEGRLREWGDIQL